MSRINKILAGNSGSFPILVLVVIFVLLTLSGIIMEIYRIHSIQSHVEYEVQRAVNIAVEDAMHDTWRQDKYGKLDILLTVEGFYDYLYHDLELTPSLEKIDSGKTIYQLELLKVTPVHEPPKLTVQGNIKLKSAFDFLAGEVTVPFTIASRNKRIN